MLLLVGGATGTGKSTFLENLIVRDIVEGKGLALIDPHGDLVDSVLAKIPARRAKDVILFDLLDRERQKDYLHRGIGLFGTRDTPFDFVLPRDVEVKVDRSGERTRVEYHTPQGMERMWGPKCKRFKKGCFGCEAWRLYEQTGRVPAADDLP